MCPKLPCNNVKSDQRQITAKETVHDEASIFPSGLNFIDETDLLCPLKMYCSLYAGPSVLLAAAELEDPSAWD